MSWVCFWRKSSRVPDVLGEIVPDVRIKMSESEDVRMKMSESESRPSKHAGSDLHPIWIGSEAGLFLDQICVAKSWHFQPELYWVQAGFAHFPASAPPKIITVLLDPCCFKLLWANSPVSGSHRARPDLGQWEPRPLLSGFDVCMWMCMDGWVDASGGLGGGGCMSVQCQPVCVCVCVHATNIRVEAYTWGVSVPFGW